MADEAYPSLAEAIIAVLDEGDHSIVRAEDIQKAGVPLETLCTHCKCYVFQEPGGVYRFTRKAD